jgi:uncharacterized protein (DUF1501 family)
MMSAKSEVPMKPPAQTCSCSEFTRATASRRTFLKGLGAVTAGGVIATMHGTVFSQTAFADSVGGNVLVVLSLRGGVDGLSLVVPWSDGAYYDARQKINVPKDSLLAKDTNFGLHPGLAPLLPLWQAGQMAAVQAVGLPQPNRSHFSAIEVIEDADPGSSARVGWLNRMVGMTAPDSLVGAVQVGSAVPDTEIYGPQPTLPTNDVSKVSLAGPPNGMPQRRAALNAMWQSADGILGAGVRQAILTDGIWAPVLATPSTPEHGAVYPPSSDLGDALAGAARVIKGNVGAQVITVDYGSWDMHTDLGTLDTGQMRLMTAELAASVAAFFTDIGSLASKVTLVTISEFGRRVLENGDAGLDHGYGNMMMLLGGGVRGGSYYVPGGWPGLDSSKLVDGDLAVTTDYRSVLWDVVRTRFPSASLSQVFPNFSPENVGVMQV